MTKITHGPGLFNCHIVGWKNIDPNMFKPNFFHLYVNVSKTKCFKDIYNMIMAVLLIHPVNIG